VRTVAVLGAGVCVLGAGRRLTVGVLIKGVQVGALKAFVVGKRIGRGTILIPALKLEINGEKLSVLNGFVNSTTNAEYQLLYEECTS
jgi:hypothetical protein